MEAIPSLSLTHQIFFFNFSLEKTVKLCFEQSSSAPKNIDETAKFCRSVAGQTEPVNRTLHALTVGDFQADVRQHHHPTFDWKWRNKAPIAKTYGQSNMKRGSNDFEDIN